MNGLDLQVGDKLQYKCNGEIHTLVIGDKHDLDTYNEYSGLLEVLKIERPKYEIIYKKKEILDSVEKEYLKSVIRPFRNKVDYIIKKRICDNKEFIMIYMKDNDYISFQSFEKETMYKGMKIGNEYTLEELGL